MSPACRELEEAILYLEAQRSELGLEFADEFDRAVAAIAESPTRWPESSDVTRKYRMHRFEYSIRYFVEAEEVVIAAVAHPAREPGYWRDRI